ncbi:MAG: dTMP kinase [Clostridia bacterium]|nr:dTMP kinase [Clostridia bacterium]
MNTKGKFITVEGCEGVGKSTQLRLLKDYFEREGIPAVFTREPGGTPVAEKIRGVLLDKNLTMAPRIEAELFAVSRMEHINNLIKPSLEEGKVVVCDRYIDSSLAYQGVARNLDIDNVYEINSYARDNCMPDLTIFIDMDPANSWRKRNGTVILNDRMEGESQEFHALCYKGFKEMCAREPERIIAIVPDEDKNVTHRAIISTLKEKGIV